MKKFDLKKINWKDKKFIFPLVIFFPVLFMGYMMIGIVEDLSSSEESESINLDKEQILDVPIGDSLSITSKADAILEAFQSEQDFTAVQIANESTRLTADTTLYSEEERALLALQEQEKHEALRREEELNQQIAEYNANLAEDRRNNTLREGKSSASESQLDKEIRMYQKILRGEEILTEEEEEERKIALIKQEERAKVLSEMKKEEILTVEKVSTTHQSQAFNTIRQSEDEGGHIRAMVDQGTQVVVGSRIRFRLLDNIRIKNVTIPAGTHVYALVSDFGDQRVRATVSSIVTKGKRIKVNLSVYDRDGIEGFFIPNSTFRDLSKEAGSQAISQSNVNFNSSSETIEGAAIQALQGVYQSASNAISKNIKENKAKIKYNTTIYLINDNE